jgi:diguanylate cyclase (GGDEF)-like protein
VASDTEAILPGRHPMERMQRMSIQRIKILLVESKSRGESSLPIIPSFDVTQVEQLSTALEKVEKESFDVVLLNLSLPDSQGLDSFVRMRDQALEVPIVIVADREDESLGVRSVQHGAQDYLVRDEEWEEHLERSVRYAIERHRLQIALRSLAFIDDLTGLYNRRGFLALAEQHLRLCRRATRGLLLFFADLDGLKQINDSYGHNEGDRALSATADVLRLTFRVSDIIARLGGDEFTVLAIDATGEGSDVIKQRLKENMEGINREKPRPHSLTLSVGVTRYEPDDTTSIEDLLARADEAMYQEKRHR